MADARTENSAPISNTATPSTYEDDVDAALDRIGLNQSASDQSVTSQTGSDVTATPPAGSDVTDGAASVTSLPAGDVTKDANPEGEVGAPLSSLVEAAIAFDVKRTKQLLSSTEHVNHLDDDKNANILHDMVDAYMDLYEQGELVKCADARPKFVEILSTLVPAGLDVTRTDDNRQTVLHHIVTCPEQPELIKAFIASGVKVNSVDKDGQGALHKASSAGNTGNVETLLEGGGNPNLQDTSGRTPLHLAAKGKILKQLLHYKANVNLQDGVYMETPLHKAVSSQMVDSCKILVNAKPDPNKKDVHGDTVLHKAAPLQDVLLWKSLMLLGGDINAKNNVFHTPWTKVKRGNNHCALIIMGRFAEPESA